MQPILCVDDEPANLALLRQTLKDHHALVFAIDGATAIRAVEKHHPALILLDVQLPDQDGFAVCRHLKAQPEYADIPVIFVTALTGELDEQAGFDAGGVDYITKPVCPPIVLARVRTHLSLVRASRLEGAYRDAIYMLGAAGHYNDENTGVHIWRMAAYARALAAASGWDEDRCRLIELAAPMHDTGKIGIPSPILSKPGRLTPEEWVTMQTHTTIGYEILSRSDAPVFQMAAEIALYHHERWDGCGYPRGLVSTDIPESARIVAVADVFDALCMARSYKEAWATPRVIEELRRGSGRHFDPDLIVRFMGIMPEILALKERWDRQDGATAV